MSGGRHPRIGIPRTAANIALDLAGGTFAATALSTRVNTTISAPSSMSDGDFLLGVVLTRNQSDPGVAITIPSGWTSLGQQFSNRIGTVSVAWKRAASEGASWTWTHASDIAQGVVWRVIGVIGSGDPLDSSVVYSYNAFDPATWSWGTVTTGTAGSALIGVRVHRSAVGLDSTDITERYYSEYIALCADIQAVAGSSGTLEGTDLSDNDRMRFLFAVRD